MLKTTLLSLFLVVAPVSAVAQTCPGTDTQEAFFEYVKQSKFTPYTLAPSAQERFTKYVNSIRVKNGVKVFSASAKFYFADVAVNTSGVVWIEDGCVIPGSVLTVPSTDLAKAMTLAGLRPEEMIKYEIGENI